MCRKSKWISIILVSAIIGFGLTGCGSAKEAQPTEESAKMGEKMEMSDHKDDMQKGKIIAIDGNTVSVVLEVRDTEEKPSFSGETMDLEITETTSIKVNGEEATIADLAVDYIIMIKIKDEEVSEISVVSEEYK